MKLAGFVLALACLTGCIPIMIGSAISQSQNERMAAVLEESKGGDPAHAGVTGLVLDAEGIVTDTVSGSPADIEGIKPGDRILEVDGAPYSAAMVPLSGPPDTDLKLLILHKDDRRTVNLKRIAWRAVIDGSWLPAPPPHQGP